MTTISGAQTFAPTPETQYDGGGLEETNIDEFLNLMIAELQNQDPLNPMENSEMLQQLSQMRSIGATDKLTKTLNAVLLGQNITTASSMIGREISALSDEGTNVQGVVDRVTVASSDEGGGVRIHVGGVQVSLQNVREILPVSS